MADEMTAEERKAHDELDQAISNFVNCRLKRENFGVPAFQVTKWMIVGNAISSDIEANRNFNFTALQENGQYMTHAEVIGMLSIALMDAKEDYRDADIEE